MLANLTPTKPAHDSGMVDTPAKVTDLVDSICGLHTTTPLRPALYIDLEGIRLSRHGSISILQIYIPETKQAYLVDIHVLGAAAFSTTGHSFIPTESAQQQTLKSILESPTIIKAFFDVRNDSDALFTHYGIKLAGIHDIQLMELATRLYSRTYIKGLAKCIENDIAMTPMQRLTWKKTKDLGIKVFHPEHGGSYEMFNKRPMEEVIRKYCLQDVVVLPQLWALYNGKLGAMWRIKVEEATKERVRDSQAPGYVPQGRHKALGPKGW